MVATAAGAAQRELPFTDFCSFYYCRRFGTPSGPSLRRLLRGFSLGQGLRIPAVSHLRTEKVLVNSMELLLLSTPNTSGRLVPCLTRFPPPLLRPPPPLVMSSLS